MSTAEQGPRPADNTPWRKSLRVIAREHLRSVVDRALAEALAAEGVDRGAAARVRSSVQRDLPRLLRQHGRSVRAVPKRGFLIELERSTNELLAKRDQVRGELAELSERVHLSQVADGSQVPDHRLEIERFERRIQKLRDILDRTEGQLDAALRGGGGQAGIPSIFREVQGLSTAETQLELKRALLADIFRANMVLRGAAS